MILTTGVYGCLIDMLMVHLPHEVASAGLPQHQCYASNPAAGNSGPNSSYRTFCDKAA